MHVPAVQSLALALGSGAVVSLVCQRLRVPPILALLCAGLVLGRSGVHVVGTFNLGASLDAFITVVICILVFEGAMRLGGGELTRARRAVAGLLTIGAATTFGLATVAAHWLVGLDWPVAALFGAILIVTGPTVVQPLLRRWHLFPRLSATLWAEAVLIDPIGVLAVVATLDVIKIVLGAPGENRDSTTVLSGIAVPALAGPVIGAVVGLVGRTVLRRLSRRGEAGAMEMSLLGIGACMLAAGGGEFAAPQGGLVAVTICGLVMGDPWSRGAKALRQFKEQVSVILVGGVFVLLGSTFEVSHLLELGIGDVIFVAVLMLVIRPVASFLGTMGSELEGRERAFVAFLAPRGVVAASVSALAVSSLSDAAEQAQNAVLAAGSPASGPLAAAASALAEAAAQATHARTLLMLIIFVTVTVSTLLGMRVARALCVDLVSPDTSEL